MRAKAHLIARRASSLDAFDVRMRLAAAPIDAEARAPIGIVKQRPRLWRCAPGAGWLCSTAGGALEGNLCRPGLPQLGRTRTAVICEGDF